MRFAGSSNILVAALAAALFQHQQSRVSSFTLAPGPSVGRTATALSMAAGGEPAHHQNTLLPRVIQGGMGIRISSWQLARQVSLEGELGVISGTAMDTVFVRELQAGDPTGGLRRALASFPDQDMAQRLLDKYYIEGGKADSQSFKTIPFWSLDPPQLLNEVTVAANYCEVWLAKHHDDDTPTGGLVGINRLTKVQLPTLASLYGAMLADVDYVIMGAGIPMTVPGALDNMSKGKDAKFPIDVAGSEEDHFLTFSPEQFWTNAGHPELNLPLKRPNFVPIVSSVVLAQSMLKRANGEGPTKGINGFVVELNQAGGHNAPPRGFRYDPVAKSHAVDLNERGEPIYGPKDDVDLPKFAKAVKGVPFWMAGAYAHADKFAECIEIGAQGVQVGTLFALSKESGMHEDMRQEILKEIAQKDLEVFTDPVASPTGYPFKVLRVGGNTLADNDKYAARPRQCSLGYLRTAYVDEKSGKIGYRCPAEPVDDWLKKGGEMEATVGRKCLCNALMANVGLPQVRNVKAPSGEKEVYVEDMLITIGDEVNNARQFLKRDEKTGTYSYSASDVVQYLKSEWKESEEESAARQEVVDFLNKEASEASKKNQATGATSDTFL